MAIHREIPKCIFCGKVIAKLIMKPINSWESPVYGDNFSHYEYEKHTCEEMENFYKEHPLILSNEIIEILNNNKINKL